MKSKLFRVDAVQLKMDIHDSKMRKILATIKKRHSDEHWIKIIKSRNGEISTYISAEGVCWIENVYLRKNGFYLDKEIEFLKNSISKLESERIEIPGYDQEMTIKELMKVLDKSRHSILKGIKKMCDEGNENLKNYNNGKVVINSKGVEWLITHYFKDCYVRLLKKAKREKRNER